MPRRTVVVTFDFEDHRLAELVSERLRRLDWAERRRYFKEVVSAVLDEEHYQPGEYRQARFRAICSILGQRGGRKKSKTPRKAALVGKVKTRVVSLTLEEKEAIAEHEKSQIWNEMMYLARLRRDNLAREADGD